MSAAANLPLSHKSQKGDGYCLPACIQMVLAYLGISRHKSQLAKLWD
ncbi:MAG: C39 family peptidase [Anaerolineae bacterium]|nr:C39 family peptidase [Anaerolineae bacterium]